MRRRLEDLARWRGDMRDAVFGFSLAYALADVGKLFELIEWRHAYLGRYMGISIESIEQMPARTIRRYMAHLSDIVKRENGPSTAEKRYL